MKLAFRLVWARMRQQKIKVLFVLMAIVASSCLVVWIVGGYQALYSQMMEENVDLFGRYDLKLAANHENTAQKRSRDGGGGFSGPFRLSTSSPEKPAASAVPAGEERLGAAMAGGKKRSGSRIAGGRPGFASSHSLTPDEIALFQKNADVTICDTFGSVRAFVYWPEMPVFSPVKSTVSPKTPVPAKTTSESSTISENPPASEKTVSEEESQTAALAVLSESLTPESLTTGLSVVPPGIEPALHHAGMAAYRASMGIPSGMGQDMTATSAQEPPYDLEEGRWFSQTVETPYEAVLTEASAKQTGQKPGDRLLIIAKTGEYQLEIVGIVEDPLSKSFYIPMSLAEKIAGQQPQIQSLGLVLRKGISPEKFQTQCQTSWPASLDGFRLWTETESRNQRAAREMQYPAFQHQALAGTLLAVLVSMVILFTTLNMGVREQKRHWALLRAIGLTRNQIGVTILTEAIFLAIPGWLGGLLAGWLLLVLGTGTAMTVNFSMAGLSLATSLGGAFLAALYPMVQGMFVLPLEAVCEPAGFRGFGKRSSEKSKEEGQEKSRSFKETESNASSLPAQKGKRCGLFPALAVDFRRRGWRIFFLAVFGTIFLAADLWIVHVLPGANSQKAAIHALVGVVFLAVGTLLWIPALIVLAVHWFVPFLGFLFRFDARMLQNELLGHLGRTTGMAAALAVCVGIFVSMQIWGYSMLGPFLPGMEMPDGFVAFLPNGIDDLLVPEVRDLPFIQKESFLPVAVEQAAFAPGSVPEEAGMGSAFANVVFLGVDVEKGLAGQNPLIKMRFLQGNPATALDAVKNRRGCLITDSISVDDQLNVGDTLKVSSPHDPTVILEYPVVGVVYFPGWQWLSKTGGVRRNFGRSGGMVFADEKTVRNDFGLRQNGYFWFNIQNDASYQEMEAMFDRIAVQNQKLQRRQETPTRSNLPETQQTDSEIVRTAVSERNDWPKQTDWSKKDGFSYVKVSTRQSLYEAITTRADSVIWGLSTMPLVTLAIMSIAMISVMVNSVRARRWQFGMMRAIGWTRGTIACMILAEAILVGVVALFAAFLFGGLFAHGALKLGESLFGTADPPLFFPWGHLGLGAGLTLMLCLIAALYPAIQTGRTPPLELLQEGRSA